jgi:3-deoxy-D-manno-octulosonic-acid transferase
MIAEKLAWFLYKLFCKCVGSATPKYRFADVNERSVWIYCATIGELNACLQFIQFWAQEHEVILITEKRFYVDAFQAAAPFAKTLVASDLAQQPHLPLPSRFILCEIPMGMFDAPFHLEYGLLRVLKQHKVPVYAVNGWLYQEALSCREHQIAYALLARFYRAAFDGYFVQSERMKALLIQKGVDEGKIETCPSFKLDKSEWVVEETHNVTSIVRNDDKPLWVAASLSSDKEIKLCLAAFSQFWQTTHRLVLVHRHPEKEQSLNQLTSAVQQSGLECDRFSNGLTGAEVIILDTFGDLRSLYQHADLVFIGKNHNPIEPIMLARGPVMTIDGWDERYSTYELYNACKELGALHSVIDAASCQEASQKPLADTTELCRGNTAQTVFERILTWG